MYSNTLDLHPAEKGTRCLFVALVCTAISSSHMITAKAAEPPGPGTEPQSISQQQTASSPPSQQTASSAPPQITASPAPPQKTASPAPQKAASSLPPQKAAPSLPPQQLGEIDYWIDPDRPHISDSSVNVPKGLWLQENGFQQSYLDKRSRTFDYPETLIRLGVANRTEVRYNVPNVLMQSVSNRDSSGVFMPQRSTLTQNMQAGFKHRLGPIGPTHFQIAINPYISIPTGFKGQSSRVDPFIKIPFSQELTSHWDLEGMESLFYPTDTGTNRRNLDWQNCIVLNRMWGRQANAFIEYVGDVYERGPMSNLIHFGGAYRPNRRQQIDIQFGFRLNKSAPIAFFGFGYSFLLGSLNTPQLTPSRFRR